MAAMTYNLKTTSSLFSLKRPFMLLLASAFVFTACNQGRESGSVNAESVPGQDARAAIAAARAAQTATAEAAIAASGIDPAEQQKVQNEQNQFQLETQRLQAEAEIERARESSDLRSANETASIANEAKRIDAEVDRAKISQDTAFAQFQSQAEVAAINSKGRVEAAKASQPGLLETFAGPTAQLGAAAIGAGAQTKIAEANANLRGADERDAQNNANFNAVTSRLNSNRRTGQVISSYESANTGATVAPADVQALRDAGVKVVATKVTNENPYGGYAIADGLQAQSAITDMNKRLESERKVLEPYAKKINPGDSSGLPDEVAGILGGSRGGLADGETPTTDIRGAGTPSQTPPTLLPGEQSLQSLAGVLNMNRADLDSMAAPSSDPVRQKVVNALNDDFQAAVRAGYVEGYDSTDLVEIPSDTDLRAIDAKVYEGIRAYQTSVPEAQRAALQALAERSDGTVTVKKLIEMSPTLRQLVIEQYPDTSATPPRDFVDQSARSLDADIDQMVFAAEQFRDDTENGVTENERLLVEETADGGVGDVRKPADFLKSEKKDYSDVFIGDKSVFDVCKSAYECAVKTDLLVTAAKTGEILEHNGKRYKVESSRAVDGLLVNKEGETVTVGGHSFAELTVVEIDKNGDALDDAQPTTVRIDATGQIHETGKITNADGNPMVASDDQARRIAYNPDDSEKNQTESEANDISGEPAAKEQVAEKETEDFRANESSESSVLSEDDPNFVGPKQSLSTANNSDSSDSSLAGSPSTDDTTAADTAVADPNGGQMGPFLPDDPAGGPVASGDETTTAPTPVDPNFVGPLPESDVGTYLAEVDTGAPDPSTNTALDTPTQPEIYSPFPQTDLENDLAVSDTPSIDSGNIPGGSGGAAPAASAGTTPSVGGGAAAASSAAAVANAVTPVINTNVNNNTSNANGDLGVGSRTETPSNTNVVRPSLNENNVTPVRYNCAGSSGVGESSGACGELETALQSLASLKSVADTYNSQVESLGEEEDKKEEAEQTIASLQGKTDQDSVNLRNQAQAELDAAISNIAELKSKIEENREAILSGAESVRITSRQGFLDGDNQVADAVQSAAQSLANSLGGEGDYSLANTSGILGSSIGDYAPDAVGAVDATLADLGDNGLLGGSPLAQNGSGSNQPNDFRGGSGNGDIADLR